MQYFYIFILRYFSSRLYSTLFSITGYHDSILMKHMLNVVDFTPKRLGQVASDSNGGLRYVDK